MVKNNNRKFEFGSLQFIWSFRPLLFELETFELKAKAIVFKETKINFLRR
jgi:hypothetical protein